MTNYFWLDEVQEKLLKNHDLISHAFLFYGKEKVTNNKFATVFCEALLCSKKDATGSCGVCKSCTWMSSQSHPDYFSVDVEGNDTNEKLIPVSVIRELKSFFELSPHQIGGKKIALINKADRLTRQAANALLKILEEPPASCVIILSTDEPYLILPTVKSRCQLIKLPQPSPEQSIEYLNQNNYKLDDGAIEYFNSSPITAIDQHGSYKKVIEITKVLSQGKDIDTRLVKIDWLDYGLDWSVNVIQKWCYDLFSYKLTNEAHYFPSKSVIFDKLASDLNLSKILTLLKRLNEVKIYASKPVNKEINLELIVIEYRKVFN